MSEESELRSGSEIEGCLMYLRDCVCEVGRWRWRGRMDFKDVQREELSEEGEIFSKNVVTLDELMFPNRTKRKRSTV